MNENGKFCKDCKHYIANRMCLDYCTNPKNGINPVTGEIKSVFAFQQRSRESQCGKDAKWFEIKVNNTQLEKPKNFFTRFIEYLYNKFCR